MKKYTDLEWKIKDMSAKEIILAMIDGLENPVMKVDMNTFGEKKEGVCYGCAATNAICKLGGFEPSKEMALYGSRTYSDNSYFLVAFEAAIDRLRRGCVISYNNIAIEDGFATIKELETELPAITNQNYQDPEVLKAYRELANAQ